MSTTTNQPIKHVPITSRDILWYIPNKIGYSRVILAIISFITMPISVEITWFAYTASCLLDAVDGTMARKYNQTSRLGAVLDMVTDRSTTAGLICFLCKVWPSMCVPLQVLLGIDISSHYMHMYATLSAGENSHKNVSAESSKLLHLYYTNRKFLFIICFLHEMWYCALYLMAFRRYYTIGYVCLIISTPGFIFKQVTNIIQLIRAALILADEDAAEVNKCTNKGE
ncbi:hypothetical protein TBLA_0F01660 [Henningerozyma blattae CBS 6284]|uniref:CDP-diacylglycerol--inositol 3-phosphatidyltransferase n=1 Tax=Henningerozyma blattae (strain ATCC 34711 / CBS 6284 / DSM 70876 / NBRC 10599 / NRRL Y-10934 / UCD 77-7) TaxID=1071380 RepID=I2H5Q6_HENB6|nr:hypothetical protein TBLA_0F01660 [Tetrapisispora blattae CBS 6284]CCH61708.1 hypothetical protein TBLA_0F01660 [Tetrapisispora blattae CBS 6284]